MSQEFLVRILEQKAREVEQMELEEITPEKLPAGLQQIR